MTITSLENSTPLYAVIDLGSNSFHMLITRQVADSVQVIDKVKRKVRLASGLNQKNILNEKAIARGLECLSFFAERLQDIPPENIRIVATATLRIATNRQEFLDRAEFILGYKISILSGLQEAELIYLGVAHTSCSAEQRLVLDIGGASTELIIGDGFTVKKAISIDMGCVSYNRLYFQDNILNKDNFSQAITAAKLALSPFIDEYKAIGWQSALGGSGTMQAIAEVMMFTNRSPDINLPYLFELQQQLLNFSYIDDIQLAGLHADRAPVIASGLAILIAIFESFSITTLQLSNGALREGLLYEMLPNTSQITIRQQTINSLIQRFHIDPQQAKRIKTQATTLFQNFALFWPLKEDNCFELLQASCDLHEVGLLLTFKYHQKHGAYILQHADLAGFNQSERQLLSTLVLLSKGKIDKSLLQKQSASCYQTNCYLLITLRLAIILCRRRKDDVLPTYLIKINENHISICLPYEWLNNHPLITDELFQENQHLQKIGFTLHFFCDNKPSE